MAARKRKVPKPRAGVGELVLVAGEQPQLRQPSKRDWVKAKEVLFLSTLAETCNVTRACDAAGVSTSAAYNRRRENAAFRSAWLAAISVAYQRLEMVLLERAFVGTEKLVAVRGGEPQTMREYSDRLGLALLKMHRDTATEAASEFEPAQIDELKQRLLDKLRRLKARDQEKEEGSA